jgi:uncharacterized protein (DUF697 family)
VSEEVELVKLPRGWWSEEAEYVIVAIAVIGLVAGLITTVVVKAAPAGAAAAITTAIATLVGLSLGSAGKRRLERRAQQQTRTHQSALQRVARELAKKDPDTAALRSIISDALMPP